MSVYDTFQSSAKPTNTAAPSVAPAVPSATPTPAAAPQSQSIFQKAGSFLSGLFSKPSAAPATPPAPAEPKSSSASKPSSVYDTFKATKADSSGLDAPTKEPAAPKSVYDTFKASKAPLGAPQAGAVESPYFYTKEPSGATIGASDQKDSSGKPFLAYRNPGDTSTTTDSTRVATTFDPRIPQKLDPSSYLTPRAVAARAALKQSMGGTYSDELDHRIALELSGSNDKSNLGIEANVPGTKNTPTDPLENSLAKDVASGKISLFDAQGQLAKAKGMKAPWGTESNKESWIQQMWDKVKGAFIPQAHAQADGTVAQKSVYDTFKATQSAPASLKTSDDFQKESERLDSVSKDLNTEAAHLNALASKLDTTNKDAVDAYNAEAQAFNQKKSDFETSIDSYNKAADDFTAKIKDQESKDLEASGQPIIRARRATDVDAPSNLIPDANTIPKIPNPLNLPSISTVNELTGAADSAVKGVVDLINALDPRRIYAMVPKDRVIGPGDVARITGEIGNQAVKTGMSSIGAIPEVALFTSVLKGSEDIPYVGNLAKIVNSAFGGLGTLGSAAWSKTAKVAVDALPIDQATKDNINQTGENILGFGAQMLAFLVAHETVKDASERFNDLQESAAEKTANGIELTKQEKVVSDLTNARAKMQGLLSDAAKSIKEMPSTLKTIPNAQGGFAKNPLAESDGLEADKPTIPKDVVEARKPQLDAIAKEIDQTIDGLKSGESPLGKVMQGDELVPILESYQKMSNRDWNNMSAEQFHELSETMKRAGADISLPEPKGNTPDVSFKAGGAKLGYNRPVEEVRAAIYKQIPDSKAVQVIFTNDFIKGFADGSYKQSLNPAVAPIIRIFEDGGKASVFTGLHETAHFILDTKNGLTTPEERAEIMEAAKKNMGILKRIDKMARGYKGEKVFEEYAADEWAKQTAAKEGFHGPLKRALEILNSVFKRIFDTYKKIHDALDRMLPKEGRQGGFLGKKAPKEAAKKTPEIYNKFIEGDPSVEEELAREAEDMNVINQKHATDLLDLEEKATELELRRETLNNTPVRMLQKFSAKSGDYKGGLPEQPSNQASIAMSEAGFKSWEDAREAFDKYTAQREKFQKDMKAFQDAKRELFQNFREDMEKYGGSTSHPAGHYDMEITEANKGVVPPIVRGGIQAPEMDLTKFKDLGAARLGRDTMERNLEKSAGPYADELKEFVVEPVRANEVERIHYTDEIRKEARAKLKDWGIKRRSNEADLIQRFGEGYMSIEELAKATPKSKQVQQAADYFRKMYDRLIDDWNIKRAQFGYSAVPKRADYFRHFSDINQFTNAFGFLRSESQLPTEIAGMSHAFKPGKPFSTAELHRIGNQTSYDAIGGMDNYLDSVSKQMFHIDSVQRGRAVEKYIRKVAKENSQLKLPNFVQNVQEWTNLTSGKAAMLDRAIEATVGRPVMKFLGGLSKLVGRNIIAGNISVALTHLVSIPLNLATVDKVPFTKALFTSLVTPLKADPITVIDGTESSFLTRRYPEKYIQPTTFDKIDNTLGFLFHITDVFKSRLAVASKYYELVGKGKSEEEAMSEADKYAGRIIGDYSTGNRPNLMSANTTKLVAQFQLGVNDGMSVLLHDIPAWERENLEKEYETKGKDSTGKGFKTNLKAHIASRLVAFAVFSYLFNQLYKQMRGSGKGIDPIGAGLTLMGMTDESSGQDFLTRLKMAGTEVAGELPFTSIGFGSFPLATAVGQPVSQILKGDWKNSSKTLAADLLSPVGGGGQVKKTIEGVQAFNAGETTTGTGQTKVPIEKTPLNLVRGAIFGKTGFSESKGAQDETTRLQGLLGQSKGSVTGQAEDTFNQMKAMPKADAAKAFDDLMKTNPNMAKRIVAIAKEDKLGMTQNDRLIKQLNVSMGVRSKYIYDKLMALPDSKARAALWKDYTDKHIITPEVSKQLMILLKKNNGK